MNNILEPTRNMVIVDISEALFSNDPNDILITYSLGSCLGVTIYDPYIKVGGLIHCMLPLSKIDPVKAIEKPYMFVDTGMVLFLEKLFKMGVQRSRAIVKIAGASKILDKNDRFKIGARNHTICRRILWKNNLMIDAENVGGSITRTVKLDIATGKVTVKAGSDFIVL